MEGLDLGAVDVGPAQVVSSKEAFCGLADVCLVNGAGAPYHMVEAVPLSVVLDVEVEHGVVTVIDLLEASVWLTGQGAGVAAVSSVREDYWVLEVMLLCVVDGEEVVEGPASSELAHSRAVTGVDDVPPGVEHALGDALWGPWVPGSVSRGLCCGDSPAVGLRVVDKAQERAHSPPVRDVVAQIVGVVPDGREYPVCREVKSVLHDRAGRHRVVGRGPHSGSAEQERLVPGCGGEALPHQGGSRHVGSQPFQPLSEEESTVIIRALAPVGGQAPTGVVELSESELTSLGVTGSRGYAAHRPDR